jgi:Cu2+-exporting ATPase
MTATANEIVDPISSATAVETRCAHCGLEVPPGLIELREREQFCCAGCRAVYQTLHACGLQAFYRLRDVAGRPVTPAESKFASFDTPAFHKLYVQQRDSGVASADLVLEGVTCAACVWLVERLRHVVPGVIEARLSLRQAIVRVTWDTRNVKLSDIAAALNRLGYTPHPAKGISRKMIHRAEERKRLVNLAIAGAIAGNAMLVAFALYSARFGQMDEIYRQFFRWISALLGVSCLAFPGAVFFRSAVAAIRVRRINLDVPIALALLAGGIAGAINVVLNRGEIYFDTLSVLVFLLLIGRFVQFRQQRYADDSVELLFSLAPATCRIIGEGGSVQEMPIESLAPGDLIEVRSGETIAGDGIVESGNSSVLQALLTGESLPIAVSEGSEVFGGSLNQGAILRIRVKSVGEDSRVGRLMRIVEQGVSEKPSVVQFADRVGGWFVVAVSLAAAGTFAYWSRVGIGVALDHSVSLLIITCPCVLGLTTPLTLAMMIGRLARRDILVKSGNAIEKLATHGQMLLDKTGTLTLGRLQLVAWNGPEELKPLVAALEKHSQHPIARALVESLDRADESVELTQIQDRGDGGLSAITQRYQHIHIGSPAYIARSGVAVNSIIEGKRRELEESGITVVLIAIDGHAIALAGLADRVRDDSKSAIKRLGKLGWHPRILSGDAQAVVTSVAKQVGIDPALAVGQTTPEAKLAAVRNLRGDGPVVMVGDGVNDAAALAAADVGIAVHGGAEASLAAADVYIASPGMTPLADLVVASRKTMRVIHTNLVLSLAYNLVAGGLAAMGKMNPLAAAILMPISSASVLALTIASVRRISEGRR